MNKTQSHILTLVEKELHFVPKYHYSNRRLALGIAAFGIPIDIIFGMSLGNMAFLRIGLPIGFALSETVGGVKDKKALQESKQLDVVIKN